MSCARGIQWNALPRELGASSTVHDRFQEWEAAGFFQALWQAGLSEYDDLIGIQWEWQAVDGVMTKAPFGCAATGKNPTDRGKQGVKRSLSEATHERSARPTIHYSL
jgi:putative transposase